MKIIKKIESSRSYVRAKTILKRSKQNIDIDSLVDELMALHASRDIVTTTSKKFRKKNGNAIIDVSVSETGARSRVTTIKIKALREKMIMEKTINPLRKVLTAQFQDKLKAAGYTTLTSQKELIDVVMRHLKTFNTDLDYLMKICDVLVEDMDSAGWSLKRIGDDLASLRNDR